jgi:hypothetical protein
VVVRSVKARLDRAWPDAEQTGDVIDLQVAVVAEDQDDALIGVKLGERFATSGPVHG